MRGGFMLPKSLYANLFPHQKEGVKWLNSLYDERKGGVLGDDMGLGKTVQIACLLKGLFNAGKVKKVLIAAPATMKAYWENELAKWCPEVENIMQFDNSRK